MLSMFSFSMSFKNEMISGESIGIPPSSAFISRVSNVKDLSSTVYTHTKSISSLKSVTALSATSPKGARSIESMTKLALTTVPAPGSESIEKLPPVVSAASLKRGIPIPTFLVVRVVVNGSVTRSRKALSIPLPLSEIVIVKRLPLASIVMTIKEVTATVTTKDQTIIITDKDHPVLMTETRVIKDKVIKDHNKVDTKDLNTADIKDHRAATIDSSQTEDLISITGLKTEDRKIVRKNLLNSCW